MSNDLVARVRRRGMRIVSGLLSVHGRTTTESIQGERTELPSGPPGTFIVSTGRCGSTLLSHMLATHPSALSVSELFTGLGRRAFARQHLAGPSFWEVMAAPRPALEHLLQQNMQLPEVLRDLSAHAQEAQEVPAIMLTTLPGLTPDPEALFAELEAVVPTWPYDTIGNQYSRLFTWLSNRLGKKMWVERSGDSLRFIPQLRKGWPDARFVHLYRDGRETALSMSRHNYFRVQLATGMLERQSVGATTTPGWLDADRLGEIAAMEMPIEQFGQLWSYKIQQGATYLSAVPPAQLLNMRYEDLVADPVTQIRRLTAFMGLEDDTPAGWIEEASRMVVARDPSWTALPDSEREALTEACRPGLEMLGYSSPA